MKNLATLLSFLFYLNLYSQVGINTTSPDYTLDVAGTVGIDTIPAMDNNPNAVVLAQDTITKQIGYTSLSQPTSNYNEIYTYKMPSTISFTAGSNGLIFKDDIDLGLSHTENLPEGRYKLVITVKMPTYQMAGPDLDIASYVGITLSRNNVLLEDWAVKVRTYYNQDNTFAPYSYPNRKFPLFLEYKEIVEGPTTITYSVFGRVQHHGTDGGTVNYYFGQGTFTPSPYFGSGVGILTVEVEKI